METQGLGRIRKEKEKIIRWDGDRDTATRADEEKRPRLDFSTRRKTGACCPRSQMQKTLCFNLDALGRGTKILDFGFVWCYLKPDIRAGPLCECARQFPLPEHVGSEAERPMAVGNFIFNACSSRACVRLPILSRSRCAPFLRP